MTKVVVLVDGNENTLREYSVQNGLEIRKEFSDLKRLTAEISVGKFNDCHLLLEDLNSLGISIKGFSHTVKVLDKYNIEIIVPGQSPLPQGNLFLWSQFFSQLDAHYRTSSARAAWAHANNSMGRKSARTPQLIAEIRKQLANKVSMGQIAANLGINQSTAYRWLSEQEAE